MVTTCPAHRGRPNQTFTRLSRLAHAGGVSANLRHFWGNEPNSGTVFEVGYACLRPATAEGIELDAAAAMVDLRTYASECVDQTIAYIQINSFLMRTIS